MTEKKAAIRIPPRGTKGAGMPGGKLLQSLARPLMERNTARLRNSKSTEQARFMGFPIGVLTTVGAKTGKERSHVLGVFPDGPDTWLVIASKGGAPTHPHWFLNLAANPDQVWLHVADRKLRVNVESLQGKEREEGYERVASVAKNYAAYPKKTDREIPVLRLTPAE
jgi:deazaflavin-dependent oxidoreductase (nitroreductase family)